MVSRKPRSNDSQHTPGSGANRGASRGGRASDYSRASYGSDRSSRSASPHTAAQRSANSRPSAPRQGSVRPAGTRPMPSRSVSPSSAPSGVRGVKPSAAPRGNARPASGTSEYKLPVRTAGAATKPTTELAQYSRQSGNYGAGNTGNKSGKGVTRRGAKPPRERMSKGTKISLIVLAVLLVLLIGGGFAFYKFISSVNAELAGGKSEEEILAIQDSLVARDTVCCR